MDNSDKEKCSHLDPDCGPLSFRKKCKFHRREYKAKNNKKNYSKKTAVRQESTLTPKDILVCGKCALQNDRRLYTPNCKKNYWRFHNKTRNSKYNTLYYITRT